MVCDGEDGERETRDERFFGEQTADVKESEGRREGDDKRMWPERGCETLPVLGSGSAPGKHQTNKQTRPFTFFREMECAPELHVAWSRHGLFGSFSEAAPPSLARVQLLGVVLLKRGPANEAAWQRRPIGAEDCGAACLGWTPHIHQGCLSWHEHIRDCLPGSLLSG